MRSLSYEYQFPFILKVELITITKFRTYTRFERETDGNSEMVYCTRNLCQCAGSQSFPGATRMELDGLRLVCSIDRM